MNPAFNHSIGRVREALKMVTYRPGWSIRAYEHEFEGVWLAISYDDINAYNPSEPWPACVRTPVPAVRTYDAFFEWLLHRLIRIESHEAREWFRISGKPLSDPHAEDANDDS